jgi:hypothetical protein
MNTRERNYRKHPHKASFLMTFHTAQTEAERDAAAEAAALDFIHGGAVAEEPVREPVKPMLAPARESRCLQCGRTPCKCEFVEIRGHKVLVGAGMVTEAQAKWIVDICETRELPGGTAESTLVRLEQGFAKFAGSQFITNFKNAPRKVTVTQTVPAAPVAAEVEIPNGRYGIHHDGEVKCYKVGNGREGTRWAGFVFLDRISSDNEFPIKNRDEKERILSAIREMGVEQSEILAAITISQCRRCGRALSDTKNPYKSIGLGPECGSK